MRHPPDRVVLRNVRQHNLKGITVAFPRRALSVITGPSGSGKSSLAFDTLYAEGQRRYIESLSTYAKQFLERMPKPLVDSMEGLSPAVAIEQKNPTTSSRSTVGTATEIADFLRLLWARRFFELRFYGFKDLIGFRQHQRTPQYKSTFEPFLCLNPIKSLNL